MYDCYDTFASSVINGTVASAARICCLFPLDRAWGLGEDIQNDPLYSLNFVHNPVENTGK